MIGLLALFLEKSAKKSGGEENLESDTGSVEKFSEFRHSTFAGLRQTLRILILPSPIAGQYFLQGRKNLAKSMRRSISFICTHANTATHQHF